VADVLYGDKPFTGTLPYTWPKTLAQADTKVSATDVGEPLFPLGYAFSK
jgi:beta-glucosidase